MRKFREYITARVAIASTAGTGATAHVCAHPCPEHIAVAVVVWAVALFVAFRTKVGA